MQAADEVVAVDPAVGQQRAPVQAAAVEDVHVAAAAHDHEVDAVGLGVRWHVVDERVEPGDRDQAHVHL